MAVLPPSLCRRAVRLLLAGSVLAGPLVVHADAQTLRARHDALQADLADNAFGRPLHIQSVQAGDVLRGEVHAVLDHPFGRVRDALRDPARWCDILILPFNTKYCHAVNTPRGPGLLMRIGRKYDQPVHQAYRLDFAFRSVAATPQYLETHLTAPRGPVGTRDYRIEISAIPLDGGRSFLRLNYAYGFGMTGRIAMQAYLATAGADKVGFTLVGRDAAGQPQLIDGMRGAVERNAMRYYLAIDAYLDALRAPPARQAEQRIQAWFDATERYPRQLREMDRPTYVGMKRMEQERQQTLIE